MGIDKDFEEWKAKNGWYYQPKLDMWRNKNGIVIIEYPTSPIYINSNKLKQMYFNDKSKQTYGK